MNNRLSPKPKDREYLEGMLERFFYNHIDSIIKDFATSVVDKHASERMTFDYVVDGFDEFSREYMDWMKIQLEIDRLKRIYGPDKLHVIPKIEPKS